MSPRNPVPILMSWNGDQFDPLDRFRKLCDERYVVGEIYSIEAQQPRSKASHSHYFACLHKAWLNLPPPWDAKFPTEDHLRAYALIKCHYYDLKQLVCQTPAQAAAVSAFMGDVKEMSVVELEGPVISVFTAKSQSMREMGRKAFQQSKQDVLDYVSDLIGVDVTTLRNEAA
jgi:hypothetical protein